MNRFQEESIPGPETRRLTLAFANELLLNFKTFHEEDILSLPGTILLREFQQDEILTRLTMISYFSCQLVSISFFFIRN